MLRPPALQKGWLQQQVRRTGSQPRLQNPRILRLSFGRMSCPATFHLRSLVFDQIQIHHQQREPRRVRLQSGRRRRQARWHRRRQLWAVHQTLALQHQNLQNLPEQHPPAGLHQTVVPAQLQKQRLVGRRRQERLQAPPRRQSRLLPLRAGQTLRTTWPACKLPGYYTDERCRQRGMQERNERETKKRGKMSI